MIPVPDRFCPQCGGRLAIHWADGEERPRKKCTRCGRIHYKNAKPGSKALIVREGRLLLARRSIDPGKGKWDLPGGYLEEDEHPYDGIVRETMEEIGARIRPTHLLGVYLDPAQREPGYILNLTYLAVLESEPVAGQEVSEIRWFAEDELPPAEEIAFGHIRRALEDWRKERIGDVEQGRLESGVDS